MMTDMRITNLVFDLHWRNLQSKTGLYSISLVDLDLRCCNKVVSSNYSHLPLLLGPRQTKKGRLRKLQAHFPWTHIARTSLKWRCPGSTISPPFWVHDLTTDHKFEDPSGGPKLSIVASPSSSFPLCKAQFLSPPTFAKYTKHLSSSSSLPQSSLSSAKA